MFRLKFWSSPLQRMGEETMPDWFLYDVYDGNSGR